MLIAAADLLHNNFYYPAVAHAAYYSCYQLLQYIWLYSMDKSQNELDTKTSQSKYGSHEFLLNEVVSYITSLQKTNSREDARDLRNNIPQLKRLRTDADYKDVIFDSKKSKQSIDMSKKLLTILKKY